MTDGGDAGSGSGAPSPDARASGGRPREASAAGAPRLVLPAHVRRSMGEGLEAAYPGEGCGVLLGAVRGAERRVTGIHPAENRWPDRDDRYLVDPGTLRRLMDREAEGGPAILGFYHSHPDAEPEPSATDREHAWPWYLYLIVPVRDGEAGTGRAWELDGEDDDFVERPVVPAPGDGEAGPEAP